MTDDERLAVERGRELARIHGLRDEVARTAAYSELGYSESGIASMMDVTEGTITNRIEKLEARFGFGCCMPANDPTTLSGPLDGQVNLRDCPMRDCRASSVVSVNEARQTFHTPRKELRRALESAEATGDSHVCTTCCSTLDVADTPDDDAPDAPDLIPEVRAGARWIAHRKSDKRPCAPWTGGDTEPVDGQNHFNQTDFSTAWEWAAHLPIGLGIVPRQQDDFVVIDLDGCRDPETGEIADYAREIMHEMDTYTEVSMSGTGLHLIARGEIPGNVEAKAEGVEIYTHGQYVSVTFDHVEGTPTSAYDRAEQLQALFHEYDGSVDRIEDRTPYEGDAPDSGLYATPVPDLFGDVVYDRRVVHPVHGSSTGGNFSVGEDAPTRWRCWRCGVSGNTSQLLAMQYLVDEEGHPADTIDCGDVCDRWRDDDELVTWTWAWAVGEGLIEAAPVPARVNPSALPDPDE